MGLEAGLLFIGPFSKDVVEHLDYPPDYYDDTNDCAIVTRSMFGCVTNDMSHELAKAVGCEAWDFNTHVIIEEKVDFELLSEFIEDNGLFDFEDLSELKLLFDKGFICIYLPNG